MTTDLSIYLYVLLFITFVFISSSLFFCIKHSMKKNISKKKKNL